MGILPGPSEPTNISGYGNTAKVLTTDEVRI